MNWQIDLAGRPKVLQLGIGIHPRHVIERYRLPGLWCMHLYRYRASVLIDGEEFPIRPGHASVIPPGASMEYRYASEQPVHLFAHFALPASKPGSQRFPIRAMQQLGSRFEDAWVAFEEAVGFFAPQPRRADVRIWDLLWRLADSSTRTDASVANVSRFADPVRTAQHIIERRLGQRLSVARLAREVGLSHNHLTRRFQASVGTTVIGYILERRALRARHLLIHSTLPIKAIAASVGIPDPHLFNKTIRRRFGKAPTRLRAAAH